MKSISTMNFFCKINKQLIIFLSIVFQYAFLYASKPINPSDSLVKNSIEISLLTFSPGDGVENVWGHTGVRVKDIDRGIDEVYNYGTYKFDEPNFLLKFLRGKLKYSLSTDNFDLVQRYYSYYQRGIYEQKLNLTSEEAEKIFSALQTNAKEENRYYLYDFFFDNCSTRPNEIIEKNLSSPLHYNYVEKMTFRELLELQIHGREWLMFGIDLIIGNIADRQTDVRQSSFLPEKLKENFRNISKSASGDGNPAKKLVYEEKFLTNFDRPEIKNYLIFSPLAIFTLLFVLELLIFYFSYLRRKIMFAWYDKLWLGLALAGGMVITFLWFMTDHKATKDNWNYLILNPLYLILLFKKSKLRYWISYTLTIVLLAFLIFHRILPQDFNIATIPLAGILILKTSKYSIFEKLFDKAD